MVSDFPYSHLLWYRSIVAGAAAMMMTTTTTDIHHRATPQEAQDGVAMAQQGGPDRPPVPNSYKECFSDSSVAASGLATSRLIPAGASF